MQFRYASEILSRFPQLRSRPFLVDGIGANVDPSIQIARLVAIAFADDAGRAHARRWTNRQSGWSAVRTETTQALIVTEALHETADSDVAALISSLAEALAAIWPSSTATGVELL